MVRGRGRGMVRVRVREGAYETPVHLRAVAEVTTKTGKRCGDATEVSDRIARMMDFNPNNSCNP
jgi:hypothetical protein